MSDQDHPVYRFTRGERVYVATGELEGRIGVVSHLLGTHNVAVDLYGRDYRPALLFPWFHLRPVALWEAGQMVTPRWYLSEGDWTFPESNEPVLPPFSADQDPETASEQEFLGNLNQGTGFHPPTVRFDEKFAGRVENFAGPHGFERRHQQIPASRPFIGQSLHPLAKLIRAMFWRNRL